MSFDPLSALFDVGKSVIERVWPDPTKQAEEIRKLEELRQKGDVAQLNAHVQIMTGQMQINAQEAAHKSIFVAGWRPAIGWIGALALGYQFIFHPLLLWAWQIIDVWATIPEGITPPPLGDTEALFAIILGMLGIGAQRSYDKTKGTVTNSINR